MDNQKTTLDVVNTLEKMWEVIKTYFIPPLFSNST